MYSYSNWDVENKYWENWLRELWNDSDTLSKNKIMSEHKLSLNFLREFQDSINWTVILTGGHRLYCGAEKILMIEEFGLERRTERHMHETLVIWEKYKD